MQGRRPTAAIANIGTFAPVASQAVTAAKIQIFSKIIKIITENFR